MTNQQPILPELPEPQIINAKPIAVPMQDVEFDEQTLKDLLPLTPPQ